ncbi:thioredoxin family protein [Fulvivirga sedimenti]|uniref:Thioredoxin family protein n=1 Tax=Fulvivirga sedimenti TaxID=2879465 RepID=A0A9X1HXI9_9BACT|nr:thioredoxin family protein [Fulvivirga sedimenti]MCA6078582.1 thioredoxin family protein [Fulvivirga sedimenti]
MFRTTLLSLAASFLLTAAGNPNGYQVGDIVDTFTLKSTSGEMISLDDYTDEKGLILIFDCNTCPYSQAYRERIKELHAMYASRGFPVLAINPNDPVKQPGDSFEAMAAYAKKHDYKHPYVQDIEQNVTRAFGATNTPHVFVLKNESGTFRVSYIGAIDNNTRSAADANKKYVQDAVNAILKGENPPETKTKAIGCSIKWKSA